MFQTELVEITLLPSYTFTAWTGATLSYLPIIAVKNQMQLLSILKTSFSLGQSIISKPHLKLHGPSIIASVIITDCLFANSNPNKTFMFFHISSIIFFVLYKFKLLLPFWPHVNL